MSRLAPLAAFLAACGSAAEHTASHAALGDSLLTLFDSMVAIHQAVPDTALLRRMHPPGDTILFVEGPMIHRFSGDSLVRRVIAAHHGVESMGPHIDQRAVLVLDNDHALLTGRERVDWVNAAGPQTWEGLLTLVAQRSGERWTIRGYRH